MRHALADGIEHGDRVRHRKRDLLNGGGARLLKVVGADVDRVPLGHVSDRVGDRVGDQAHAWSRRERVRAAAQVLLQDVVLGGALKLLLGDALLVGGDDVKRKQPCGRGVDRHRGVHLIQRDVVYQGAHVTQVRDRHPDLADLATSKLVIGVIAGLRGQIERHRQPRLALLEISPIELV